MYAFFCCPCTAYNLRIFVFPDYGKFRCTAFLAIHREIISLKAKTLYKPIFARLVTNSFFVIIATLIITFSIWIVKNCHQDLFRYFFIKISTYTDSSTCQLANSCQPTNSYQLVKVLTSPCSPPHTHATSRTHTQHGQEKIHIV